jgi:hypothetical protein
VDIAIGGQLVLGGSFAFLVPIIWNSITQWLLAMRTCSPNKIIVGLVTVFVEISFAMFAAMLTSRPQQFEGFTVPIHHVLLGKSPQRFALPAWGNIDIIIFRHACPKSGAPTQDGGPSFFPKGHVPCPENAVLDFVTDKHK